MRGKIMDIDDLLRDYTPDPKMQAVLICLEFAPGKLDSDRGFNAAIALEEVFRELVELDGIAEVDGHEFHEDSVTYFIYGLDADKIYEIVFPVLSSIPYLSGSHIVKQFGGSGRKEEVVELKG